MAYTKYSLTPANNTAAPPDGAPEGMLPSAVNDTMRDMMAQIRDCGDGIRGGTYTMTAPVITGGSISGATVKSTGYFVGVDGTSGFAALGTTGSASVGGNFVARSATSTFNANGVEIYTNGAERFRITSAGLVGINTTSPAYQLEIKNGSIFVGLNSDGSNGVIESNGALFVRTSTGNPLVFGTNTTERMRVDSSGNLNLNTTTPFAAGGGQYNMLWDSSVKQGIVLKASSTTFNGNPIVFFNNAEGLSGVISQSQTTVSYGTSSDYRLKDNIAPMTGALEKVQQLKPVTYKWKINGLSAQGFIAHELQEVVPDCVIGAKDAVETINVLDDDGKKIGTKEVPRYQSIDTSFLVATLAAAIQEQQAMIEELKIKVAALEAV
jgi:hypothetical protein